MGFNRRRQIVQIHRHVFSGFNVILNGPNQSGPWILILFANTRIKEVLAVGLSNCRGALIY